MHRPVAILTSAALASSAVLAGVRPAVAASPAPSRPAAPPSAAVGPRSSPTLTTTRKSSPDRTEVTDASGAWVATFTVGARTVSLAGPVRTFSEPGVTETVTHNVWVRVLPSRYDGGPIPELWLLLARLDRQPDLLATAFQYVQGAPPQYQLASLGAFPSVTQIAGAGHYGPVDPTDPSNRLENSDLTDYLQLSARFGTVVRNPDPGRRLMLDCSGFVRIVERRNGYPLSFTPDGVGIPRRSYEIAAGPGVVTVPNTGAAPASPAGLVPGDVVVFDADPKDGPQIDHVGFFVGTDSNGHPRFLSSRKKVNGQTMGDVGGSSTLDGTGLYARSWRGAIRP